MESILPGQTDPYVSDRLLYYAHIQLSDNSIDKLIYDAIYEDGTFTIDTSSLTIQYAYNIVEYTCIHQLFDRRSNVINNHGYN